MLVSLCQKIRYQFRMAKLDSTKTSFCNIHVCSTNDITINDEKLTTTNQSFI